MSKFIESIKQMLFGKPESMHPKLVEADRDLLFHAQELRQQAESITYLDHATALSVLDHALGLCDEVLKRPQNHLAEVAKLIRNTCHQDILDREYLLYRQFSSPAKFKAIVDGYRYLAQQGHDGAEDKLGLIQQLQSINDWVSSDVEAGYTSFDELSERLPFATPRR